MRGVTLRQLRAFAAVARHHSFVRAASELRLTPSAVSLQIKELEQTVGLPLFGRGGKSVSLTRAGELLLVDVRRALLALQDAEETLGRLRGRETGVVSVGMVSNAKYFLPRLLAHFHAEHAGVELRVSVGNREQLVRQLCSGEVELAIMGTPPAELDSCAESFAPQPLGIVAAPAHPLANERQIPVATLRDHEFVVREPGSGTRAAMERFFREARVAPLRLMEMGGNETIKQAVIANMGLAFVSLHTAGLELQRRLLVILDVVGLPLVRHWYIVNMKTEPLSGTSELLRRFILEKGGSLINEHFDVAGPRDPGPPDDAVATDAIPTDAVAAGAAQAPARRH
jgi:DNA-binding transcriptional LysR family regulator